ncbi:MAG TPA: MbcA/ParS/Xre antitoxin family protein [Longimicrobiaceae bacterium]|nr:MbcA/ParS/Xre antitoxin family protein [Longimicrobiaceae bacterium]
MALTAHSAHDNAPEDLGAPALRTFFNIAERWELGAEQQMTLLGIASPSTYYKWRKQQPARISPDLLERLSYLLGIYKDLQILLPDRALADSWLHRPNSNLLFGGEAPLSRMLSGHVADLYVVRRYLDAERGGWQ